MLITINTKRLITRQCLYLEINNLESSVKVNDNDHSNDSLKHRLVRLRPIMGWVQMGLAHMYVLHHLAPLLGYGRSAFIHP